MGKRRLFSKDIVSSDAFLDMPLSSQALYFHLGMEADDRGYISNPKSIIRLLGAAQGDLEHLIAKKFVLVRSGGLILIKHWRIHNYIPKDRFKETNYLEDLKTLYLDENLAYSEVKKNDSCRPVLENIVEIETTETDMDTDCIQDGYKVETQDKLSKVKVSEDKLSNIANLKNGNLEEIKNKSADAPDNITPSIDINETLKGYSLIDAIHDLEEAGLINADTKNDEKIIWARAADKLVKDFSPKAKKLMLKFINMIENNKPGDNARYFAQLVGYYEKDPERFEKNIGFDLREQADLDEFDRIVHTPWIDE